MVAPLAWRGGDPHARRGELTPEERLAPERLAPERLAPERLAPESRLPAEEGYAGR
jgi:hypothetical protein